MQHTFQPATTALDGAPTRQDRTVPAVLGLAGVLLILFMALFQVYDILRRLEIVLETERHRLLNLARAVAEQTASSVQTVDAVLRVVAAEQSHTPRRPEHGGSRERLQAHITGIGQIADLLIADADGRLVGSAEAAAVSLRPAQNDWFKVHSGAQDVGLYVSKPFLEAERGRWTIAVSRRISNRAGAFAGAVVAYLDLQHFQRFYGALDLGPGSAVSLLRAEGDPVVRFPGGDAGDVRAEATVLRELADRDHGTAKLVSFAADGGERICAAQLVPGFPLVVGVTAQRTAVLAPWYVQVMHSTVRTTLLCLSVALLTWLALRQLGRRERAEQRLRVQTALLDELFESAPEAIVLLDRDRRVMRVNREFPKMFGFALEEAAGRTLEELIVPAELRLPGAAAWNAVDPHTATETERMRKDGRRLQVSMLAAPIDTAEGRIASYAIFRDITERRLAEVERAKLEVKLRQAEKLEAIGTMAVGIAHDFGSILTAMLNYGEVALSAAADSGRARRPIERMMAAAQRAPKRWSTRS
jgi:PAS domain S-box-containing protein